MDCRSVAVHNINNMFRGIVGGFRFRMSSKLKRTVLRWTLIILLLVAAILFINVVRIGWEIVATTRMQFEEYSDASARRPKIFLLVVIASCGQNYQLRESIRATWLQLKSSQPTEHVFVIGGKNAKYSLDDLKTEMNKYGDIVLLADTDDSYGQLTTKMLRTYHHVANNFKFEYVLKCDDDSFVRIDKVVDLLQSRYHRITANLYLGFFDGSAPVKKIGRWREREWNLCDRYLPYALGGGYILSESLVQFISNNRHYLAVYQSEDVSVGTWLSGVKVSRVHEPRFDTEYVSRGCSNGYLVTHKHDPSNMHNFYHNIVSTGQLCDYEYKRHSSYIYNWNVPPSRCCIRNASIP